MTERKYVIFIILFIYNKSFFFQTSIITDHYFEYLYVFDIKNYLKRFYNIQKRLRTADLKYNQRQYKEL